MHDKVDWLLSFEGFTYQVVGGWGRQDLSSTYRVGPKGTEMRPCFGTVERLTMGSFSGHVGPRTWLDRKVPKCVRA
jgi:hypothetical protein